MRPGRGSRVAAGAATGADGPPPARRPRRLARWAVRSVAVLAALALVVVGGTAVRVWQVARLDSRAEVDAIVVLGASQFDGRPSEIFRARLEHAAELYSSGVAPVVVTVGGNRQGDRFTEGAAGGRYLRDNGLPREAVVEVGEGTDTFTSLRAVAAVAAGRGWERVVLVTDPWHSFRARVMAGDVGLSARTSPARSGPVVRSRSVEARYILRETAAVLYYRVFGATSGPPGPDAV